MAAATFTYPRLVPVARCTCCRCPGPETTKRVTSITRWQQQSERTDRGNRRREKHGTKLKRAINETRVRVWQAASDQSTDDSGAINVEDCSLFLTCVTFQYHAWVVRAPTCSVAGSSLMLCNTPKGHRREMSHQIPPTLVRLYICRKVRYFKHSRYAMPFSESTLTYAYNVYWDIFPTNTR